MSQLTPRRPGDLKRFNPAPLLTVCVILRRNQSLGRILSKNLPLDNAERLSLNPDPPNHWGADSRGNVPGISMLNGLARRERAFEKRATRSAEQPHPEIDDLDIGSMPIFSEPDKRFCETVQRLNRRRGSFFRRESIPLRLPVDRGSHAPEDAAR